MGNRQRDSGLRVRPEADQQCFWFAFAGGTAGSGDGGCPDGAKTFKDYKYLGTRIREYGTVGEYRWTTYGETATSRPAIGSGLVAHGIPQGSGIAPYFINRPEWLIVDHACTAYSYISVPVYDTLGLLPFIFFKI